MELDIEISVLQNLFNEFCLHKREYNIDFDWENECAEYKLNDGEFDWRNCNDCGLCKIDGCSVGDIKRDYCFAIWHRRILDQQ